jgi:hypothetical protein
MNQSFDDLNKTRRFAISEALVPKLRELQERTKERYTDKIIESEDVVVMTLGMGNAMYLTFDGRIIIEEWNYPDEDGPPREAKDVKEMLTAIVVGAKQRKAPELLSLLPQRPKEATDCRACEITGWRQIGADVNGEPVKIVCWDCAGTGWINNN